MCNTRKEISSAPGPVRVVPGAANRPRSRARRWTIWFTVAALSLAPALAAGETFKCVDAAGKTSYQANPCPIAAEPTLKVQAPAPPGSTQRPQAATTTPTNVPAANSGAATASSRGGKGRVPSEADFRGPRETWERLGSAIRRGDKDAALKELTPSAKQRLASIFDTVGSKSTPLNAEDLGSIRSVMLAGEGLATITLTRTKADGTYVHQVNLIRDADGKWRIDSM
jgi:hypothetical protein